MKDPCLTCELPMCDENDSRCHYFKAPVQIVREPTRREMVKALVTERLRLKPRAALNADRVDQMESK